MSVKCEEPLNELTVQVWLLYHHPNFNYWTLFVNGTELRTDRQTDEQTEDPITANGIKNIAFYASLHCSVLIIHLLVLTHLY